MKINLTGLKKATRKGIGLIELAMGLGIAAIIIAGALAYFSNANSGSQVNASLNQVAAIQQVVRSLASGQSDYAGMTQALVANSNQLPRSQIAGTPPTATGVQSPFRTPVTVRPGPGNSSFEIGFGGIPAAACNRLATSDLGTGMLSVYVLGTGTNIPSAANLDSRAGQGAYNAAGANTACASASNNLIAWRFN
jgi:type II secretory pathway pseudopilin PulG